MMGYLNNGILHHCELLPLLCALTQLDLTNIKINKERQAQRSTVYMIPLYQVQDQAKLICGVKRQSSGVFRAGVGLLVCRQCEGILQSPQILITLSGHQFPAPTTSTSASVGLQYTVPAMPLGQALILEALAISTGSQKDAGVCVFLPCRAITTVIVREKSGAPRHRAGCP